MTDRKFRKIFAGLPVGSRIGNAVTVLVMAQLLVGAASNDLCEGKPNGVKIQDPVECRGYLLCHKGKTYQAYCDFTEKFDSAQQSCVPGNCPPCEYCNPECVGSTTASSTSSTPSSTSPSTPSSTSPSTPSSTSPSTQSTASSSSSPGSNRCDGHGDGDMIRDEQDCSKFYVCSSGVEHALQCPEGLVFDTQSNICNYPSQVECGAASTPTDTSSSSTSTSTPTDTSSTSTSTVTTVSVSPPTTPSTSSSTASSSTSTSTTTASPPIDPNSCVGRPDGDTIRDPNNCAKYYMCINGNQKLFVCPDGLYFDTNLNVCNLGNLVDCNNPTGPTTSSSSSASTPSTASTASPSTASTPSPSTPSSSSSTSTTNRPPVNPNSCEGRPNGEMYRDPNDCSKFYVCVGGWETAQFCPNGLYFDTTIDVCNYPWQVDCSNDPSVTSSSTRSSTTSSTTTTRTTPTTTRTTPTTTRTTPSTTTTRPPVNPNSCEGKQDGEMYRDPNDCSKFYVCVGGWEMAQFCPNGLYFDTTYKLCNYPIQVDCTNDPSLTSTTTRRPTTTSTSSSTSTTSTARPTTTTTTTTRTPPTTTSTTRSTTTPSTITTTRRPSVDPNSCEGRENGESFRDQYDCSKYYVCSGGQMTVHTCPIGLYFDTVLRICNYPRQVNCNSDPAQPTTTTRRSTASTTTSTTPSTIRTTTTTTPRTTTTTTTTTRRTTTQPITSTTPHDGQIDWNVKTCQGRANGTFFRNPEHCRIYYVCRDGLAVKHSCPLGQWFNDTDFVCNMKSLVSCPTQD